MLVNVLTKLLRILLQIIPICFCFYIWRTFDINIFCVVSSAAVTVLLADGADEAGRVVGLSQSCDHFPLHEIPAAVAAGAVHALVVQCAQIFPILHEEAPLGEVTAAY